MNAVVEFWGEVFHRIEAFCRDHSGLLTLLGLLGTLASLIHRKAKHSAVELRAAPISRATRLLLLDEVEQRATVGYGLREAIRIDLNLTETPAAVPVDLRVLEDPGPGRRGERSTTETIEQVFKRAGGRLLILGEPGTGKTNLLLELARGLVTAAKNDAEHHIPILFSLARWTLGERVRTLAEWLKADLRELYGLTAADAETLIRNDVIIPLLDGLDEVDEQRRIQCVRAINEYQSGRSLGPFTVCCRSEEYAQLGENEDTQQLTSSSRINAKLAIRVERLSPSDVERQIALPNLEHVRRILARDPVLRSFVDTPLWLHVLYLGALGEPPPYVADNPRDRLYEQYVTHVLKRRPERAQHRRTDSAKLLRWLGWLAAEMRRRHQTQFVFETLDFSWLAIPSNSPPLVQLGSQTKAHIERRRKLVRLAQRLTFGLAAGLTGWLAGGWIFGVLVAIFAGFRFEGRVEAAEHLHFDWRRAISRWRFSLSYGATFALAFGWVHGPMGGVYVLLVAAIFEMFQGGFRPRSGNGGSVPNRGTRRSLRYALRVIFLGGAIASLTAIGARIAASNHSISSVTQSAMMDAAGWIAFAAFILGGEKGGWFTIRHYAVRVLLWHQQVAPMAYVEFLNESVERLFLIRRGSSYEFIHLTFRDYMATKYATDCQDVQRPNSNQSSKSSYVGGAITVLARCPANGRAALT